ncbi:MAG TPA: phosphodiester glycosidase family protein [Gemmatimonadaceae bacterium]|nr:phosphodiester glycosidase family protein [Gemmatimonadaceae bacterium]
MAGRTLVCCGAAALVALSLASDPAALAVERDGTWHEWWRDDRAPRQWTGALAIVESAVQWHVAAPGVEWGTFRLSGSGEAWRLRVIVARLDPSRVRLTLAGTHEPAGRGRGWTIDQAPAEALVAFNAGQFSESGPWGWVVRDGREVRPPGSGPLAPAVVVDASGRVRLVPADSVGLVRQEADIALAFQSYPAVLLADGEVPRQLFAGGSGVNLRHRDARLALGLLRDGRILVAMTRFEALGGALSNLPFGLTTPEMAAVMGALGASRAVLLDGGISSQLLVREVGGAVHTWRGIRQVPLGFVALPR